MIERRRRNQVVNLNQEISLLVNFLHGKKMEEYISSTVNKHAERIT